ncbi:MAG: hypothetical protein Q7S43_03120 [bacterium]|nr:hypothetical protein [bacterium]MDO8496420.1 hypothetical protein [bacterium]
MLHEVSLAEFEGPLTELKQQCSGKNGRERFEEFKLWLKGVVSGIFKCDMRKEGWTLLENVPRRLNSIIDGVSFLKGSETSTNGEEMVRRARTEFNASYGQEDAEWLLEHQDKIPAELRKFYLVFPGTIWQDSDGCRGIPCLGWRGGRWILCFGWLGNGWYSGDRLVRPCK